VRWRARVVKVTGATRHSVGRIEGDAVVPVRDLPAPVSVVIEPSDGAFLLLRLNAAGVCIADTWHQTVAEAKAQALIEYEIQVDQWRPE